MALEIEAKMKLDDPAPVRARLHECAAQHVGEFLETNTFFDTPGEALHAEDRGLRLRQKRDLKSNQETFVLTYKGPRQESALKSREEIELTVSSGRDAADLLVSLGFNPVLTFQKKRQSWMLDDCHVELDELPHLGHYVEIEGPREDCIMTVREQLGLSGRPLIKSSYIGLLIAYLKDRGMTVRSVMFALS
jgi:adenylate cyclase class 2